ncbi:hypothetical protein Purlil1_210 [Purpureocillium lilacinum]|uniref:C2H2-type domain-containing protein n=1 Tax=Purpureocillium lilacinum TaxID=33203 RepID=A0ABR0CG73_PURLI|nr:hypothetical protein Purlil1_210 [Purpureocillium lilacinum]
MTAEVMHFSKTSYPNFQAINGPGPTPSAARSYPLQPQPRDPRGDRLSPGAGLFHHAPPTTTSAPRPPPLPATSSQSFRASGALSAFRPRLLSHPAPLLSDWHSAPRPRSILVASPADRGVAAMSVAYEPRNFIHEGAYPSIGEDHDHDDHDGADQRFTDSEVAEHLSHYTADASLLADEREVLDDRDVLGDDRGVMGDDRGIMADDSSVQDASRLDLGPTGFSSPLQVSLTAPSMAEALSDGKDPSPGAGSPSSINRVKAVAKPDREVTKGPDGRFHCAMPDCKEEIRSFSRKCEWNKHMDKHERPYRCPADGCENLPGFTYSGGLLRHEREVHGKHGGPKNTVNCPHPNCKRHTGKGFSRQENLNEHLRRVHTNMEGSTPPAADSVASPDDDESEKSGTKRKRRMSDQGEELTELRAEVKRLREQNEKLKSEVDQQSQHSLAMMAQIAELQDALRHGIGQHGLGAPTAQMI